MCRRPNFDSGLGVGGNFWDGRATGFLVAETLNCIENPDADPSTVADVTFASCSKLPTDFVKFLGPIADQAFASPFFNPKEQGLKDAEAVCKFVKDKTKWGSDLYEKAFGEQLDCGEVGLTNFETQFAHFAVALAAYQMSDDLNRFDSLRDIALESDSDGLFPLDDFSDEQNEGHDLFYGEAGCSGCHSNGASPPGGPPTGTDDGTEPFQTYTEYSFHNLGIPRNLEIGTQTGPDVGLPTNRGGQPAWCGQFATTSLRNLTLKPNKNFVKAYMHNGFFKDLWQVVHFYNTARTTGASPDNCTDEVVDLGNGCFPAPPFGPPPRLPQAKLHGVTVCPSGEWTAEEAIAANCWPVPEMPNCVDEDGNAVGGAPIPSGFGLFGNLGLTKDEELALVAFMETLDDTTTAKPPKPYKGR